MRWSLPFLFVLGCAATTQDPEATPKSGERPHAPDVHPGVREKPVDDEPRMATATPAATPVAASLAMPVPPKPAYPTSRMGNDLDLLHGVPVRDPYRWLEDGKSADVAAWVDEQNAFARARLDALPGRAALRQRLKALSYADAVGLPEQRKGRLFYLRRHADREKAILYYRAGERAPEKVLIDPNGLSADGSIALGAWEASADGKQLAYALKKNNGDEGLLYVMDVDSGVTSKIDVIAGFKYGSPVWTPKGDGFYYNRLPIDPSIPVADRPGYAEIRFHPIGQDPAKDPLVHPKTGSAETFIDPSLSPDGRWLFVSIHHGWASTDWYYRDLKSKDPAWKTLVAGVPALFEVTAYKDKFYVFTNENAPRFKIMVALPSKPARSEWKELVGESKDTVISEAQVRGGHLVLTSIKNATDAITIYALSGKKVRELALPALGSVTGLAGTSDNDALYYSFTSFAQPTEVFKTSLKSGATASWGKSSVVTEPGSFDVEQVWYPSKDGVLVSMFLVHKKGVSGPLPYLLLGYGGFNVSLTPVFRPEIYAWLETGGGFAMPNLRGGGEYGEEWHRAGMLERKQTVFDDFAAAGEYLLAKGHTTRDRLAVYGRSNGGLLVGAAVTQRPDLFAAAICGVPLLDMVRYHLFGSGKTWVPEYGSADDLSQFRALYAYSPYHRLKAGTAYPALLMLAADADDRVDPMHARKFVAAMQAATSSDRPVLFRVQRNAGHGGADMVAESVEQSADALAFLRSALGVETPAIQAAADATDRAAATPAR